MIKLGIDAHLERYVVVRINAGGTPQTTAAGLMSNAVIVGVIRAEAGKRWDWPPQGPEANALARSITRQSALRWLRRRR